MYEAFTHWIGLRPNTKGHENPSGHERRGGMFNREIHGRVSCPASPDFVPFRVQPRRETQRLLCPSVSREAGFSVFSGSVTR